ncbi:MAG: hypothetical protein WBZ36_12840 [Candidatus Nitrosopolaris sp.]|jgi:hypothetical protein
MSHKMTKNNHKTTTVLLAVAVISGLLVGTGHTAIAGTKLTTKLRYPGINKQIDTNEDQKCKTIGRSFPIVGGTVVCQLCHCHSVIRNIPFWTLV